MKELNRFLQVVASMPLILAATLVASPAAGQDVDTKGENELREQAQKVDKAASRADAKHVTAKIVDEFKGKTFDFGDGKGARALTAMDVQRLKGSRGWAMGRSPSSWPWPVGRANRRPRSCNCASRAWAGARSPISSS